MSDGVTFRVRHWVMLALALFALNAALTFHNIWPTPWIALRREVSIDIAVIVLALVVWSALARPPGRLAWGGLTFLLVMFAIGRYAEVTSPALYGRPVNLYWDSQYLPNVAAMLAEVAPWWLLTLFALGVVAVLGALVAAVGWCLRRLAHGLSARAPRLALGVLAFGIVSHYAMSRTLEWPSRFRYSVPVSVTYAQQARFFLVARTAAATRTVPIVALPRSSFGRLGGDDVLLVFLESYGAVTYDMPSVARVVAPRRDDLAHAARETDRHFVSAFVAAPTFGGGSWLSHASMMSGYEVRDPGDYMLLLTQQRDTLPKLAKQAGYRAIAVMPGMRNAWPEGAFYGFDTIHDAWDLDYRGPDFGWWRIPDQFSLASVAAIDARSESHAPLFTFLATVNTHIPFVPLPPYQPDWQRLLTDEPFDPEIAAIAQSGTPEWEALGRPYAESFVYTFDYLAGYLRERVAGDELLILIGDHQPAASVAGTAARWDVPVHIVTRHADLAAALVSAGFIDGVALAPGQRAIGTLPELLTLLLATFDGARDDSTAASGSAALAR
jgi:hypothetical protein